MVGEGGGGAFPIPSPPCAADPIVIVSFWRLFTKLLGIVVVGHDFSHCLFRLERGILPTLIKQVC